MTTVNKPLPHRPFSVALDVEKASRPRRQPPQMTSVSNPRPRPYVPANDKFTVPPVPKRVHLVSRSPSPPHYHAAPNAFPSSPKPSHSFSQSQSNPHSSTSDLVPSHLKQTRSSSFWRRHWFVILVCILALLGISVAVGVVLAHGNHTRDAGVYTPASISSSSSSVLVPVSEAPVGSASVGSSTTSSTPTSPPASVFATSTSASRNPLSSTSSRPS